MLFTFIIFLKEFAVYYPNLGGEVPMQIADGECSSLGNVVGTPCTTSTGNSPLNEKCMK